MMAPSVDERGAAHSLGHDRRVTSLLIKFWCENPKAFIDTARAGVDGRKPPGTSRRNAAGLPAGRSRLHLRHSPPRPGILRAVEVSGVERDQPAGPADQEVLEMRTDDRHHHAARQRDDSADMTREASQQAQPTTAADPGRIRPSRAGHAPPARGLAGSRGGGAGDPRGRIAGLAQAVGGPGRHLEARRSSSSGKAGSTGPRRPPTGWAGSGIPPPLDWMLRAQVDIARERMEPALAALDRVPDDHAMAAQARLMAGQLELRRHRPGLAEEYFSKAVGLDPEAGPGPSRAHLHPGLPAQAGGAEHGVPGTLRRSPT